MEYIIEEINRDNVQDYIGLDIVAFYWGGDDIFGKQGIVFFITRDGRVCQTHYGLNVTREEQFRIFPPFAKMDPGQFEKPVLPPEWVHHNLGKGNHLVVHESLEGRFLPSAEEEINKRRARGESAYLIGISKEIVLSLLKPTE